MPFPALAALLPHLARAGASTGGTAAVSGGGRAAASGAGKSKISGMPADLFASSMGDIMGGKMGKEETKAARDKTLADEEGAEQAGKNKKAAMALGDSFKKIAKGGLAGAAALAALPSTVHMVNKLLLTSAERLQRYNSTIAMAMTQLQLDRTRRDIKTGAQTASSTKELARATSRLEESMQPFVAAGTNVMNVIGTKLADGVAGILENVKQLPPIKFAIEWLNENQKGQANALLQFFDELAARDIEEKNGGGGGGGGGGGFGGQIGPPMPPVGNRFAHGGGQAARGGRGARPGRR